MHRILGVVLFASFSITAIAHACSLAAAPLVMGWLGLTWDADVATTPPANVASLAPIEGGAVVVHDGIELWRAPPGTTEIDAFGRTIPLGPNVDETAPTQPVIREASMSFHEERGGCGYYSCGDFTTFDLDIEASDDMSPRDALTFAIWRSRSQEVAPTRAPDYYLTTDRFVGGSGRPDVWNYESNDWEGRDTWVVVRVLDQAGNASPFSEPFLVDTGASGGCAVATPHAGVAFPLALALLWITRRRR